MTGRCNTCGRRTCVSRVVAHLLYRIIWFMRLTSSRCSSSSVLARALVAVASASRSAAAASRSAFCRSTSACRTSAAIYTTT